MGQARVIEVLKEHGELTADEVVGHIDGLHPGTIKIQLRKLVHWGLVEKMKIETKGPGDHYKYRLKEGVRT